MDERVKQMLLLGREHYGKREFDKAEQLLRQVLDHDDRFAIDGVLEAPHSWVGRPEQH